MLLSLLVTPSLAAIMIMGSIAVMVGIIRRSTFVPLLAVIMGVVGVFFFSNLSILPIPGVILSLLVIPLGAVIFVIRRRVERIQKSMDPRQPTLSTPGASRSRDREYLSDSGHWRLGPS